MEKSKHSITSNLETNKIVISVFKDAVDQLNILANIFNYPSKVDELKYETIKGRFSKAGPNLNNISTVLDVFVHLKNIFNETLHEIKTSQQLTKLNKFLEIYEMMKYDEILLKNEYMENSYKLKNLRNALEDEKCFYHYHFFDTMKKTGIIKDEIEDMKSNNKFKINYVQKWQKSKAEMNDIVQCNKEIDQEETIQLYEQKIEHEEQINQEMSAALNELIKDQLINLEKWEERYHQDMKMKLKELNQLKQNLENLKLKKRNLEELYCSHMHFIINYKAHKAEMIRQQLEQEKRINAAVRIQAWWRGTMVRKGFGKYRKKKDKKPKKRSPTTEHKT